MTVRYNRAVLLALALLTLGSVAAMADPPSIVARLNLVEGAVSFHPGSLDEWAPAVLNYPLTAGDHLWTEEGSRAELHAGSAVIRMDGGTEISFLNLDDQAVQVGVTQGRVNVRLWQLDPGDNVELDTPNAVVTLQEPGSYTVTVQDEQTTMVAVRGGQAEVSASGNDFTVPAGQVANLSGSGSIAYYLTPLEPPSPWDAWYGSRDSREQRLASFQYVPRGMIGAEDLDDNGSWLVLAGYGPCWVPHRVAPGWAPYKFGRWAWVAPWGWTWVDDAPWGFAPFHYGRWAFVTGRWVWVPGTMVARPVYAPALVVFVGGGPGDPNASGIGWFPLGPREVYVPPYAVSTTYVQRVNVTTVNITVENIERINVTQVTYVNRTAPYAVTAVPRQMFTAGRPTGGNTISFTTEQARRAPIIGMGATVSPQRESVIFNSQAAPAPRPPAQVVGRPVFGRLVPAPAPVPFSPHPAPLAPVTVYQRPPQVLAPQAPPVRQSAPVVINPMRPGQPFQPQGQPPAMRPQPPQPMQPQPPQPQPPAMRPQQPQPVQPQGQPQGMMRPPQPMQPQQPQPVQPQGMMRPPQPMQPQQPPTMRPQQPQAQPMQPQQPPAMRPQQPQPQPVQPQQPPAMRPQQPQPQPVQPQQPQQPPAMRPQQPQGQGDRPEGQPQPQGPGERPQVQPQGQGERPQVQPQGQGSQSEKDKDNQGRGRAQSLLNDLKNHTLPDVQRKLDAARNNPNSRVDVNAFARQLDAARSALNDAQSTLSKGNVDAALQQAQAVQRQLADLDRQLSGGG